MKIDLQELFEEVEEQLTIVSKGNNNLLFLNKSLIKIIDWANFFLIGAVVVGIIRAFRPYEILLHAHNIAFIFGTLLLTCLAFFIGIEKWLSKKHDADKEKLLELAEKLDMFEKNVTAKNLAKDIFEVLNDKN